MKYVFVLKNEKSGTYRIISQLIVFLNLLGFCFLVVKRDEPITTNFWIPLSIFVTAAYTFFAVIERVSKKPMPDFWHRYVFFWCATAWLKEGFWYISVALLLFVLLDYLAHRKLVAEVSEKKIKLPAMTERQIEWHDLNNVILKDDLLTVDFKNNKLFQHLILNSDWDINEKEFNDFCRAQLDK